MKLLFRLMYVGYRHSVLVEQWTFRKFTVVGLALLGGLFAATMVGFDTENTVAYQGFMLVFFLVTVAVAFGFFFPIRFRATRILPRFGTAGTPLHYSVEVTNLTRRPQAGLALLDHLAEPVPPFADWLALQLDDERYIRPFRLNRRRRLNPFRVATFKEAALPTVPPRQTATVSAELLPLRRGVLRLGDLTLVRPDPFGIFRALRKCYQPQSVLILPRRYWLPPIALPGTLKYQQGGVALASNVGQSEEFVALRDYRRGDPPRHIHWRSWAKTGRPIVKEFEDEFFVRHALVLDTFTDRPHTEAFEEAVSVAASFACTVLTQESLLDLLFIGPEAYCFTAGRGVAHADQMLEVLAAVRPCHEKPLASLEHLVINHARSVSGCICVLLAWDSERQRLVEKLKALQVPLLVLVISGPEDTQPLEPGPMREAPECLHRLIIGRIEEQLAVLT